MPQLHEEYRPKTWADVAGHSEAKAMLARLRKRGIGGRAYWLSGPSGSGKTTIARLLAEEVADDFGIDEVDAKEITSAGTRDIERRCATHRIMLIHAVILIAESPKCRIVDHAAMVHFNDTDNQEREIPDEALDKHTLPGRRKGRGWDHFFDESSKIVNLLHKDPYRSAAREVMSSKPLNIGSQNQTTPATKAKPKKRETKVAFAGRVRDGNGELVERQSLKDMASDKGFTVVTEVTDSVAFVVSSPGTAKAAQATMLGIRVIDFTQFEKETND